MPNQYRKQAASGGRVESVEDKLKKASVGKLTAETPSFTFGQAGGPKAASPAPRGLPRPADGGSPVQPASITKVRGTKPSLKETHGYADDLEK